MIANLGKPPKNWLYLKLCRGIFNRFKDQIQFDQPIPPFDTRAPGKLEGILGSVKQTFDKEYLNSTVLDAAVAYFVQFTLGHAFINGNKRMAVLFTHFFLLTNLLDFKLSNQQLYTASLLTARMSEKGASKQRIKRAVKKLFEENTVDY